MKFMGRYTGLVAASLLLAACSDATPSDDTADTGVVDVSADVDTGADTGPDSDTDTGDSGDGLTSSDPCDRHGRAPIAAFSPVTERDYLQYVDPMIGTAGSGNVIPGALLPHGMVRVSPDTVSKGGAVGAYYHDEMEIEGFTHTHLEGPGGAGNGYSELLLMPGVGTDVDPSAVASAYGHDDEAATPGYYQVRLTDPDVNVELTASHHAGVHRYTFPASTDSFVALDLYHNKGFGSRASLAIVGDAAAQGVANYNVHPGLGFAAGQDGTNEATLYFHLEFSRPFTTYTSFARDEAYPEEGLEDAPSVRALFRFDTTAQAEVVVSVGISFISVEQARANLEAEVGGDSFDAVHQRARGVWNDALSRVDADADADTLKVFYTSLYHSLFQPADYTEASGKFMTAASLKPEVYDACGRGYYTDDWCMWDTYRTSHPLGTLVEPELRSDIVTSMVRTYEAGGWLPKCSWHAAGYSRVMTGNPQVAIIADAWLKGLDDFDHERAWEAMVKTSDEESDKEIPGFCGYVGLGTPPSYRENGWVSAECDRSQDASMTLEIAYADYCMAQVAGIYDGADAATEARYRDRAQNYRNNWNPAQKFMQSRMADGSWREPFDPTDGEDMNGFVEATSWIFSFFVPHDLPGLIGLMGGADALEARLDTFFDSGYYDATNQPSFHIPYLYNIAGNASKTQAKTRELLTTKFSAEPNGLPGNDDAGSMSAWYTLGAMGLYPIAPGDGRYEITSPLLRRYTLHLHPAFYGGGAFTVEVQGDMADPYIQSVSLNGQPLSRTHITHQEIVDGGALVITLGPNPSGWPN